MPAETRSVVRVEQLASEDLRKKGVTSWPIWEKETSRFDWTYDSEEQCYFLKGRVTVRTPQGAVEIRAGDFVTFPKGLSCVWEVHEPVRKHYRFG